MSTLPRFATDLANSILKFFDAKLVSGKVTSVSAHPDSPELVHQRVFPWATYSPWLSDPEFASCYEQVRSHTLVDIYRCYELWTLARQLVAIEGDFLEVGVWRGGTGCLICEAARDSGKTVYLADTFSGVVKAGQWDPVYTGGEHADTSEETVRHLIGKLGLRNAVTLKGIFPEDTAGQVPGALALVHCDVDVYSSARDVVEWAIPRLSTHGVVVFDDYGFEHCQGVTTLVNELRRDRRFLFLHNLNGHAILIRK